MGPSLDLKGYFGQQEEPTILISRLLLRMRHLYVVRIHLDFHYEWMECTECNLIMRVWTFYHSKSDHANLIKHVLTICHVKLMQSSALEQKAFWPSIIVIRTL